MPGIALPSKGKWTISWSEFTNIQIGRSGPKLMIARKKKMPTRLKSTCEKISAESKSLASDGLIYLSTSQYIVVPKGTLLPSSFTNNLVSQKVSLT